MYLFLLQDALFFLIKYFKELCGADDDKESSGEYVPPPEPIMQVGGEAKKEPATFVQFDEISDTEEDEDETTSSTQASQPTFIR